MADKQQQHKMSVQEIVDDVVTQIQRGEFRANAAIREVGLCRRYGVSRTPVREALRLLQNNGVVEYIPRCGVQVANLTMKDLMDITDTRIALETLSVRTAASHVSDEDIRYLQKINQRFLSAEAKAKNGIDAEFHAKIARISGNSFVEEFLRSLHVRRALADYLIPFRPERIPLSYQEHENIIQALKLRDPDLAAKQAEVHFHMSQMSLQIKMEEYMQQASSEGKYKKQQK